MTFWTHGPFSAMFANFIYLIVVLLIYITYIPKKETHFSGMETLCLFLGLALFYCYLTWKQFHRLGKRIHKENPMVIDLQFDSIQTRISILAVVLFAVDVHILDLPSFFAAIPPFSLIPTLLALFFIALFIFHLVVMWTMAHGLHTKIYSSNIEKRTYVLSNISISIPVLLPWVLLSAALDIIEALPFNGPKQFLDTLAGQITYFLVFLLVVAVLGPAMIQKFWRCKPLEAGYMRDRIENLCRKAGVEYNNILYWPVFGGRMITAGVMGLVRKFRYILVTDALLRYLNPEEIDAVIAHEIGHVKKRHLQFYLFFFLGFIVCQCFSINVYLRFLDSIVYFKPVFAFFKVIGYDPAIVIVPILITFVIYFRYIFGYFMRNFERQADTYVYSLFNSAWPLITTLEKIVYTSGQSAEKPNWHHFSVRRRIDYLKNCEIDRKWIARHDRKIIVSIGVYLGGVLLLGTLWYYLGYGVMGERFAMYLQDKIIRKDCVVAVEDAEKFFNKEPENPTALNNLAWVLSICEDAKYRDPVRALVLAKKAASLDSAPHIMDTLAESYYANGMFREAVEAETRALSNATGDRSHYEKQLEKFRTALAGDKKRPGF